MVDSVVWDAAFQTGTAPVSWQQGRNCRCGVQGAQQTSAPARPEALEGFSGYLTLTQVPSQVVVIDKAGQRHNGEQTQVHHPELPVLFVDLTHNAGFQSGGE